MAGTATDTARTIHTYLSRLVPFGFWGGVLVADGDDVVIAEGYGLASRTEGRPNTPETSFSLSSITKPFTAAAVLALEEDGRLAVTDPLARHLPGVPADKAEVTLHHLLTHTSGLETSLGEDDRMVARDAALAVALGVPLRFPPGTRYEYCNAGYTILAAVVEEASGEPYESYLRRRLLEPAGLRSTGYRPADLGSRPMAHFHVDDVDRGTVLDQPYPSWTLLGSGEMLSTLDDLHRWHRALQRGVVLGPATVARMTLPFLDDYAYGWAVHETPHGRLVTHGGATTHGSCTDLRRYVDRDLVVALFCNRVEGGDFLAGRIGERVAALAFGDAVPMPPEVPPADERDLARLEGIRSLPRGGRLSVARRHEHVRVRPYDPDGAAELHGLDGADAIAAAARALDVLRAARAGDLGPFVASRASERPAEAAAAEVRRFVAGLGDEGMEVLGIQPSGYVEGAVDVIVGPSAPRSEAPALLTIWRDGRNHGVGLMVGGGRGMASVPCVPLFPGELVGWRIGTDREVRVRLPDLRAPARALLV